MSKNPEQMRAAELHSAGATVRHASPFADLPVPTSTLKVSTLPAWAQQLFRIDLFEVEELTQLMAEHIPEVDELVVALLEALDRAAAT